MAKVNTERLKLMYTLFETLFLSNEMRQKYNLCYFVLFLKLPLARTCSKCPRSAIPTTTTNRATYLLDCC